MSAQWRERVIQTRSSSWSWRICTTCLSQTSQAKGGLGILASYSTKLCHVPIRWKVNSCMLKNRGLQDCTYWLECAHQSFTACLPWRLPLAETAYKIVSAKLFCQTGCAVWRNDKLIDDKPQICVSGTMSSFFPHTRLGTSRWHQHYYQSISTLEHFLWHFMTGLAKLYTSEHILSSNHSHPIANKAYKVNQWKFLCIYILFIYTAGY